jgi:hypothetical protein
VGESSRWIEGGFEARFAVSRADGRPCNPRARYFVLDLGVNEDGSALDPHAHVAAEAYADSVAAHNAELSADLKRMLGPAGWPPESAQHKDAK